MYLTRHISAKLSVLTAAERNQLQQHISIVKLWHGGQRYSARNAKLLDNGLGEFKEGGQLMSPAGDRAS